MIDSHCHLEQKDYDNDREQVIEKCKEQLKAVITSCALPKDFEKTMKMIENHKNFIFATIGIHPEFIKEISEKEKDDFLEIIKKNKDKIVGIGETGLDYWYIKEKEWQEKQKQWFIQFIELGKELKKPLIIHSRESEEECVKILEDNDAKNVLMHMFGANHLTKRVIENGWSISINAILLKSKKHKKVIRDAPLDRILLETDAPWLAPESLGSERKLRNNPTYIRIVAEKVAEVKKLDFKKIWDQCCQNSINFFNLPL